MEAPTMAPMPEVAGVSHRRIRAGDLDVHVAEAGDGPPVVLLHGSPQHWFEWHRVLPDLARDHRAIAPDLRGCGWTSAPQGGYDAATQTADVLAILDALDVGPVVLVAHDYSLFLAWRIAFDHPERLAGLVAVGAPHPWTRPSAAMLPHLWQLWFQPVLAAPGIGPRSAARGRQRVVRWMLDHPDRPFSAADREAFLAPWRDPSRARALSAVYRRLILPGMAEMPKGPWDGRHLAVPTRIVLAGDDPVMTESALGPWRGTADDLRVTTAEGAGHYLAHDRPDAVAAAVRSLTQAR
ncbi:alpha/beta hydrolase [Agrococcus terreus]|uniref:alpha/beta fold hydrolase n=1 Tax=Agrococcus terreus TaxID=574649 RepID=UPI00384FA4DD